MFQAVVEIAAPMPETCEKDMTIASRLLCGGGGGIE